MDATDKEAERLAKAAFDDIQKLTFDIAKRAGCSVSQVIRQPEYRELALLKYKSCMYAFSSWTIRNKLNSVVNKEEGAVNNATNETINRS